jgi:hypothetical protein
VKPVGAAKEGVVSVGLANGVAADGLLHAGQSPRCVECQRGSI